MFIVFRYTVIKALFVISMMLFSTICCASDKQARPSSFIQTSTPLPQAVLSTLNGVIPSIKTDPDSHDNTEIDHASIDITHGAKFTNPNITQGSKTKQFDDALSSLTIDHKVDKSPKDLILKSTHMDLSVKEDANPNLTVDIEHKLVNATKAFQYGQFEAAASIYRETLQISPDNIDAIFGLAVILHNSGELIEARSLYTKLLALAPSNHNALNNFLAIIGEEAPEEAILELKKMEAASPYLGLIPAQIAMTYVKLENYKKAAKYLNKAMLLSPDNIMYRYNLAIILDKLGDTQNASHLYRQILSTDQNNQISTASRTKINERLVFLSTK